MSTLDNHVRIALHYAVAAIGCVGFNLVYAQFVHGVSSAFMTFMFAVPLILGALPALVLHVAKANPAPIVARQAWALAIAALTVASCLHGIFDIAGTASPWLPAYLLAAAVFSMVAMVSAVRAR